MSGAIRVLRGDRDLGAGPSVSGGADLRLADELTTAEKPTDLRNLEISRVVSRVEQALDVRFTGPVQAKRRTLSGPTTTRRWVRIEARDEARARVQGWGGIAASSGFAGIAKPRWYRAISWRDPVHRVLWRADETQFVNDESITSGGLLRVDPDLSDLWWETLTTSLKSLAAQPGAHSAKLNFTVADQDQITVLVERAAAALGHSAPDPKVSQWVNAHADLTWANLTAPRCWLLDWEDWGLAPRGFDAAMLLICSLAVPALSARVRQEFAVDLSSRDGLISILAVTANLLTPEQGEMLGPLRREAASAMSGLFQMDSGG